MTTQDLTLNSAMLNALNGHWKRQRTYVRTKSQVTIAVQYLESLGCKYVSDVTEAHITRLREWSLSNGSKPATVNCRLATLAILGIPVKYCKLPNTRKWFLSDPEEIRLSLLGLDPLLLAFVRWTVATGLRIEESLRLRWSDLDLTHSATVAVPGTKTKLSEAILPLSDEAKGIMVEWKPKGCLPSDPVFPVEYPKLRVMWNEARAKLGVTGIETATLKALRRSFARRAHVKGMPVDILRQYLRHGDLKTTQGYLRLVGGYSQDEMRRFL